MSERLAELEVRLQTACARAGRPRDSVTLVAVSKLHPGAAIREAYALGLRHFGENYAQELRDKAEQLADLPGLRWHAIGPLQTNKAKYVARAAHFFHALDRVDVARELGKRREGAPLRCFLEVNLGDEQSKAGVTPAQAPALLEGLRGIGGLEPVGLMGLPPPVERAEQNRPHFRRLRELGRTLGLAELSMGTTADFGVAVEEGATYVRVGTALFGERPAP